MIKGVGIDMTRISRYDINNEKLVNRILSKDEKDVFNSLNDFEKQKYLASRFSLKEAYFKASFDKNPFSSFSFLNDKEGKPYLKGRKDVFVSVSDEDDYVVSYVIIDN